MKKSQKYYFFIIVLIASFLTMDYFANKKMVQVLKPKSVARGTASLNTSGQVITAAIPPSAPAEVAEETSDTSALAQFMSDFKYEVFQIGKVQSNTDEVENRLQGLARQMEPEHRNYLKSILQNQKNNGDDRAMAIELLSRSQTPEAAEILKNYATDTSMSLGTRAEQELVFKAQAIEGVAAYQDQNLALSYLNEISKKTSYTFLQDRASRAQAALKNQGPPIEQQDIEALKKLSR